MGNALQYFWQQCKHQITIPYAGALFAGLCIALLLAVPIVYSLKWVASSPAEILFIGGTAIWSTIALPASVLRHLIRRANADANLLPKTSMRSGYDLGLLAAACPIVLAQVLLALSYGLICSNMIGISSLVKNILLLSAIYSGPSLFVFVFAHPIRKSTSIVTACAAFTVGWIAIVIHIQMESGWSLFLR